MSTTTAPITSIALSALPAIGADLDGGIFFGLTTGKDGNHYAATFLPAKSDKRLPWKKAMEWATKQGGALPTRPVAALLFANLKDKLEPLWHWTSDEEDASYAWYCDFIYGGQYDFHKSYEGSVVAVRLIPLTA
jgi:hypothetical protein